MEVALYGPGGFYQTPPIGPDLHFVTSPHVHPVFGELLARGVHELWEALGSPDPLHLTEVGAADGTLARSLLGHSEGFPVRYTAIERSPGARASLAAIEGLDVRDRITTPIDLVLANELLDNLPFRILRGNREVRIGREGDRFVEVLAPADADLVGFVSDAEERVIPVGAFAFLDELADALERGFALLIDYGDVGTSGGPVHGYREHTVIEDVLATPGTADITSGVDFALVIAHAEARGLSASPVLTQRDALSALGFDDWSRGELRRQQVELDTGGGREAVAAWSGRNQAGLLVDPTGLGRLRWLLLATGGLEPPTWWRRAEGSA